MRHSIIIFIFIYLFQYSSFAQLTVSEKKGNFGYIDKNGNVKIPYIYNEACNFGYPGYAYVQKNGKEYLIDTLGKEFRLANNDIDSLSYETLALDLSTSRYQIIPDVVFNYPNLEVFFINDANMNAINEPTYLETLSSGIGNLINLRVFDLSKNRIKKLPSEIGLLASLTFLDLSFNQIDTLPPEIGELKSLTQLDLSGNNFTFLPPEIGKLKNLTFLRLFQHKLTSLPPEIGKLTNLEYLELTNFNEKLKKLILPNEFWNLKKLKKLDLECCLIEELPHEIANLSNLKFLDLQINKLKVLPEEIGNLKNLETLYLGSNILTTVSPKIGLLVNLKHLDLSNNNLKTLPLEITNLTKLKELYLIGNDFSEMEKQKIKKLLPNCKIVF